MTVMLPGLKKYQHWIVLYKQPNNSDPWATVPEKFWMPLIGSQQRPPADENLESLLNVAQTMTMKHYPHQRDPQGRMRVLIVLAFGQGSRDLPARPGMAAVRSTR